MNSRTDRITRIAQTATCVCAAVLAGYASAQLPPPNPPGTSLIVLDGATIQAQFVGGGSAGFDNELFLDSPANSLPRIFHNHLTPLGTKVTLGTFTPGTELIFRNHVVNTGDDFFSGPGTRNTDGIPHAQVTVLTNAQVAAFEAANFLPANFLLRSSGTNPVLLVGFEDTLGGGDLDYNDLRYLFNNLASPVPEASQVLLMLVGVGFIGWLLKRRALAVA